MKHRIFLKIFIVFVVFISLLYPQPVKSSVDLSDQLLYSPLLNSGVEKPFSPLGHLETSFMPRGELLAGNTDTVFAYGPGNNYVYQSEDSGHMWHTLPDGVYWADKRAFAVSPDFDVDHTMFIGLNYGNNAFIISTDGGQKWHNPQDEVVGPILNIAISPDYSTDHTLYISTGNSLNQHLLRSTDGGEHWQVLALPVEGWVSQVIFSPFFRYDHTLFISFGISSIWCSNNGGDDWLKADNGLGTGSGNDLYHLVIVDYLDTPTLLAATASGLAVSVDRGANWYFLVTTDFTRLAVSKNVVTNQIDIFGIDSATLFLEKSSDWGGSWNILLGGNTINNLALSPDYAHDQTIYAKNDSSFWVSSDGGEGWALSTTKPDLNLDFNTRLNFVISPDFGTDKIVYAYLKDTSDAIFKSADGGKSWSIILLPTIGKAVLAVSPDYAIDQKIWVGMGRVLFTTTDDGGHWDTINDSVPFEIENLRISPGFSTDQTLFITRYGSGLARSENGGLSWKSLGADPFIDDIELSPAYPVDHTLFVSGSQVSRSVDMGETWQNFNPLQSGGGYIIELSPSFSTDGTIFAGVTGYSSGGLARSTNRGGSWTDISFDGVHWYMADIAISPHYAQDQTLMVAADTRPVYLSEDGGTTWFPLQGIPPVGVYGAKYDLAMSYENGLLIPFASTPSALYRYKWPQLIAPNSIWIGVQKNITDTVQTVVPVSATGPGYALWRVNENAPWLTSPVTGTLPDKITLTVNPALLTGEPTQTVLSLQVNWSYQQAITTTIPVNVYFYSDRLCLPMVQK